MSNCANEVEPYLSCFINQNYIKVYARECNSSLASIDGWMTVKWMYIYGSMNQWINNIRQNAWTSLFKEEINNTKY